MATDDALHPYHGVLGGIAVWWPLQETAYHRICLLTSTYLIFYDCRMATPKRIRLRSLNVDEQTHFKLKQAAIHGKTLAELVKELVDRFLPKVVKP